MSIKLTNEEAIEQLEDMDNVYNQLSSEDKEAIDMAIAALKDARPKGKWIDKFGGVYRCSECRAIISETDITDTPIKSFNFCPFCGADMRKGIANDRN